MNTTRHFILMSCVCAASLCSSAPAFADQWGTGSFLVWPSGDAADEMATDVPLDTQVWIDTATFTTWPSYTLRDSDGQIVKTHVEIITRREGDGPRQHMAILTPLEMLEPNTVYTVASIDDLESGSHEYHRRLDEVPFETGAASTGGATFEAADVEYVAHTGLDLEYGGCCYSDRGDTIHAIRWRPLLKSADWLARLDVTYPGEEPLTTYGTKRYSMSVGALEHIATHSLEQDEFPCVDFTLTDIAGHEIASYSTCTPAVCTSNPPSRGAYSPEFAMFLADPLQWDAYSTSCDPLGQPDEDPSGCATTPASPIPRTPLALGALALLGLLRTNRSRKRHV